MTGNISPLREQINLKRLKVFRVSLCTYSEGTPDYADIEKIHPRFSVPYFGMSYKFAASQLIS